MAKNKFTPDQEEEIAEMVERAIKKDRKQRDNASGNDQIDDITDTLEEVADSLKQLNKRERSNSGGGGGLLGGNLMEALKFFNSLNLDNVARWGINKCALIVKGPVDSAGVLVGGATYRPSSNASTKETNGKYIEWLTNSMVLVSRALLGFFSYVIVLLKWEILDGLTEGEFMSGSGGFDISELLMLQLISGALTNQPQSSGSLDFLSGLFGGGSVLLSDDVPFPTYTP